jgi:ribulose-bisphosphate carboxylase large chain
MTSPERIEADYLLETAYDPRRAAEAMAGEQSSGTFVAIPGETPELKARAAARVESLRVLDDEVREPSLPFAAAPKDAQATWRRAQVTLSWPLDNLGPSLPNLLATVAGNLFELLQVSGLRLLDLRLPQAFAERYPGPKFGVAGTRRLAGVETGPLIGTIVKPSVGLGPEDTAALTKTLCEAGIDFIKDDELQSDGPACPFDERVRAVMRVINAHADRTGKKVMFAFNLTGDLDQMRRRHDVLLEHGATCLMASLNSVGLVGMIELARFSELPIHAHRNGWGYLSRHPLLGWSFVA